MCNRPLRITNSAESRITNRLLYIRNSIEFVIRRGAREPREGQAALTLLIFFLFAGASLLVSFSSIAFRETRASRVDMRATQSYALAEAGVEDIAYRIRTGKAYPAAETLSLDGSSATVTVTSGANQKTVESSGDVANSVRRAQVILQVGTGVSFSYGVQVGDYGLEMEEQSEVIGAGGAVGNVYSNGPVAGNNGATVSGGIAVATTTVSLDRVDVLGTARASAITRSSICGDAYYQSIDSSSLSFLQQPSGSICPNPLTPGAAFPATPPPPPLPMPISDAVIQQWENDAASGGTIAGNCGDNGVADCNIPNNGTLSIGPKKIAGDLVLTKKQTLNVTGTLWVTGHIDMDSSSGATVKCDPAFGAQSCIVIADGWIHIKNNAIFQGSGVSGSYLLVAAMLDGCYGDGFTRSSIAASCTHHHAAVDFHNNATGAIFYVPKSLVFLHNGVALTELTAGKAHLENNATVTFEQGLLDVHFSSGPTGGWNIQQWGEVK